MVAPLELDSASKELKIRKFRTDFAMTLIEVALVMTFVSLVALMWWNTIRQSAKNLPQADNELLNTANPFDLPSSVQIAPPN